MSGCTHDHVDGWYVGIEGCRGCGKVVNWHDAEEAPVFAEVRALRERVAKLEGLAGAVTEQVTYVQEWRTSGKAQLTLTPEGWQRWRELVSLLDVSDDQEMT